MFWSVTRFVERFCMKTDYTKSYFLVSNKIFIENSFRNQDNKFSLNLSFSEKRNDIFKIIDNKKMKDHELLRME